MKYLISNKNKKNKQQDKDGNNDVMIKPDQNFTEKIINLYADFYNNNTEFVSPLKTILRPNNTYIIVDLIKSLIDIQRKKFRQVYTQVKLSQDNKNKLQSIKVKSKKNQQSEVIQAKPQQNQKIPEKFINYPTRQINKCLQAKYMNFIMNIDIKQTEYRINQKYNELKQKNIKNLMFIQKFRHQCLGSKKNLNYDYSGLYTKQQAMKIQQNLKQNLLQKQRQSCCNLNNNASSCQFPHPIISFSQQKQQQQFNLKQKFKLYLQICQKSSLLKQSQKYHIIRDFFRQVQQRNYQNKINTKFIQQRINLKLNHRKYWIITIFRVKELILFNLVLQGVCEKQKDSQNHIQMSKQQQEEISLCMNINNNANINNLNSNNKFDKKLYLDFNKKKQHQLLDGDKIIYKRQLFLPVLKQNQSKQLQTQKQQKRSLTIMKKIQSQSRFLPRFKQFQRQRSLQKQKSRQFLNQQQHQPKSMQLLKHKSTTQRIKSFNLHNLYKQSMSKYERYQNYQRPIFNNYKLQPLTERSKKPKNKKDMLQQIVLSKILQRKNQIKQKYTDSNMHLISLTSSMSKYLFV